MNLDILEDSDEQDNPQGGGNNSYRYEDAIADENYLAAMEIALEQGRGAVDLAIELSSPSVLVEQLDSICAGVQQYSEKINSLVEKGYLKAVLMTDNPKKLMVIAEAALQLPSPERVREECYNKIRKLTHNPCPELWPAAGGRPDGFQAEFEYDNFYKEGAVAKKASNPAQKQYRPHKKSIRSKPTRTSHKAR
ncbi:MAG: hypothetical protein LBF84_02970 [Holosporales bacterium]|jgi:hypothetical protein|nr:hypothetical protein [Holosporales bacterium]